MDASAEGIDNFSWRKIGFWHFVGIAAIPVIFGWPVVLRDGYTKRAKKVTGIWMAVYLVIGMMSHSEKPTATTPAKDTELATANAASSSPQAATVRSKFFDTDKYLRYESCWKKGCEAMADARENLQQVNAMGGREVWVRSCVQQMPSMFEMNHQPPSCQ